MAKKNLLLLLLLTALHVVSAQNFSVQELTSGTETSLRGLSVVNDNVIWVSGSNGKVGRSTNAGKNWKWMTIHGFEKAEFRDIEAFGPNTAVIMASGEPAYMLKTTDAGETWKIVFHNDRKGMFLDAIDFFTPQYGIAVGDPVNGKIFFAETRDAGDSWKEIHPDTIANRPDSGEAFFAASGTNIRYFRNGRFYLVSGGKKSRLFSNNGVRPMPVIQGKESTGANSIAVFDRGNMKGSNHFVVVGGDFANDTLSTANCFYTKNGGKTWKAPKEPPQGYKSCVEFMDKNELITCGPTGVELSFNGGRTWQKISDRGFHVCRLARFGTAVYLAGSNGRIARLVFP